MHVSLKMKIAALLLLGSVMTVAGRKYSQVITGDRSWLYTSDSYTYNEFALEIYEQNYIVFKVKACSDAGIALAFDLGNITTHNMIEIKLGGWENTRSIMRMGPNGVLMTEANITNILHCGEFRTFWIHWSYSHIHVGAGSRYYEQEFMRGARPDGFYIHYAAFSTGFGHTGVWEIEENQGYYLYLHTPDTTPESFQYMTKSVMNTYAGFVTFKVRACHDVFVSLGENINEQLYRLNYCAFADNDHFCIWFNGVANCSQTQYHCNCQQEQQLWFSFLDRDQEIIMGIGAEYGRMRMHSWKPPVWKAINYVSFATGWGSEGFWRLDEDKENAFGIFTGPHLQAGMYNAWILTAKHHFLPFELNACDTACLAVSNQPGIDSELNTYHVCLGEEGNQKSSISQNFDGEKLVQVNTPHILTCNTTRYFWISWIEGLLRVGYGHRYGYEEFMHLQPADSLFDVQGVGFGSPNDECYFLIRKNHGDQLLIGTPEMYHTRVLWNFIRQDVVTFVRIQGEKDAVIVLNDLITYFGTRAYEVIIGYDNNAYTFIRMNNGDGYDDIAYKETPGVLSPDELRTFWISWLNGYLRVGQGWEYGKRILVEAPEPMPTTVNAMSISSLNNKLYWEFESEQGGYVTMKTPDNTLDWNWLRLYHSSYDSDYRTWLYFQMSGGAAQLVLAKVFRSLTNGYKIVIGSSHNTMVQLYKGSTLLQTIVTEDRPVMHTDELNDYWISWTGGIIKFGRSRFRNSDEIFSYDTGGDFSYPQGIALSGYEGHTANWRYYDNQGLDEVAHDSKGNQADSMMWLYIDRREDFAFGVTACNSTYITLSAILHSTSPSHTYQIRLVDDVTGTSSIWAPFHTTMGEMYRKEIEVSAPDLLSCTEERFFWISWQDGYVSIGRGIHHGYDMIMSMYDFNPFPVKAALFETKGVQGTIRVAYYGVFGETNPTQPYVLTGGAIAGLVIGYFVILAMFIGIAVLIIRPPPKFQQFLTPPPSANNLTTGSETITENISRQSPSLKTTSAAKKEPEPSFENPLYGASGSDETAHAGYEQEL